MAAVYHGGCSGNSNGAGGTAAAAAAAAAGASSGWLRPGWVSERCRIERLELLDELEEWRLMQVGGCANLYNMLIHIWWYRGALAEAATPPVL
jgi:hypothetical protein